VTWLSKQGIAADRIVRFIRPALGSTVYVQHYLSEDLGATCTKIIENTVFSSNAEGKEGKRKTVSSSETKSKTSNKRLLRSSDE
jgi:hypothetical protein